jgi:hypothetical protein
LKKKANKLKTSGFLAFRARAIYFCKDTLNVFELVAISMHPSKKIYTETQNQR